MFHLNSDNPIIELFLIRNDSHYKFPDIELFKQDPLFFDLPDNTRAEISTLNDALNSHKSLNTALLSMPFHPDYNIKVIEILHKRSEQGNLSDFDTFCFLFQCLSWISLDSQNQTVDSLITLIEIFKSTIKGNFRRHSNAIFQELLIIVNLIQKESLFKILIQPIIDHIQTNLTLDKDFYPTFLEFISKIQNMRDKSVFPNIIPVLAALVADQRKFFEYESLRDLAYLISREITDLDMNALYILCFCSVKDTDDEIISDLFLTIPHLIYQKLQNYPVINKVSDFKYEFQPENSANNTKTDENSNNSKISPDTLVMPSSEIVENKVNLLSLCDQSILSFIKSLVSMLKLCGKHSLNAIMTALCAMKELIFQSEYCIDFIILILLIFKPISMKCNIHPAISLILNQFTFCETVTIFTNRGLTNANNRIRNDIFEFVVKNDEEGLTELFIRSSSHPLLYAELLMRATFQVPLPNEFYSSSVILPSLIGSTMLILQTNFPSYVDKVILARSIIFNVLFRLFDEPITALRCFENHIFTAGFLSLIFEPSFSKLIVRSLSECLSKFPVLPEPVSLFVASLFKMCSLHHDEQLSSIATNLAHEIIRSISHNISIGPSFEAVFDSTLEFLQIDPTPEMLEAVLSMLLLIAQGNLNLLVNSTRFNNILNLIHSVEGDEPSDLTFLKMQNLMYASTNLALNMIFLIRIPDVLALVLIAFSKSKRLSTILEHIMKLCTFSIANIYACHDGNIDLILLKSLFGSFTYKKRKVEFSYDRSIIESHVMKLISQIVIVRSSFTIDNLFLSLLLPNEKGEYSQYSDLAISTLNSIFLTISKLPYPTYPISSSIPYLKYDSLNPEGLDKGFIFAFDCFIDVPLCMTLPYSYCFFRIVDSRNFKFSIFYHKKGLYARFEGNGFRTSAPLCKDLPSNQWVFCLVVYEEDRGEYFITLKVGKEDNEEVDFKKVDLQGASNENNNNFVQCTFCFLEDGNDNKAVIPADQPAPVMMGDFCLISGCPSDQMFESLRLRGFQAIPNLDGTAKVLLSHKTHGIMINSLSHRQSLSIKDTMVKHLTINDLLPIFAALEKAPKLYAESIINSMRYCIDYSNVVYTDTTPSEDEALYLNTLAEITFSEPLPPFPRELQKLSSISVLAYLILTNSRELINFQLFQAFFSQSSELTNCQNSSSLLIYNDSDVKNKDVPISQEFVENILFSPFYWCSVNPSHMKRICSKWSSAINRGFKQANESLFETFLVQTHLLVNFSKKPEIADTIKVLSNSRFQTLEAFAMTKSKDTIVSLVIGMIFSIIENFRGDNEKVRIEVIRYLNFLIFMSETPCKAFNDDSVMALLSLVDIFPNDSDIFCLLMCLYQKADSTKTMQRISQLSIRFFSLKKSGTEKVLDTSSLPLDVQCIRAVICGDNDSEVIDALTKSDFTILSFMWYFWPTVVGLVRPKTMVASIELLSRYPKEFEKITMLFSVLKVFQIFKMREFRKHYLETLANKVFRDYILNNSKHSSSDDLVSSNCEFTSMSPFDSDLYQKEESDEKVQIENSSVFLSNETTISPLNSPKSKDDENLIFSRLVLPFFITHFYKFSSKPFSSAIITEMAKNADFADISNLEKSMKIELSPKNKVKKVTYKIQNGYSYPTGTFSFEKLVEIFSIPLEEILQPLDFSVVYRPAESQTIYELCKDLTLRLQKPLSEGNEIISVYFNTPKNSDEYPTVAFNTFTYMEQVVIKETAIQSLLKTISNLKSILIVNNDRTQIVKKYNQSVSIQRKHFYEFVTYGRVKSNELLSHRQGNFFNTSYHLQNPFIELVKSYLSDLNDDQYNNGDFETSLTNSSSENSKNLPLKNQLPKLDEITQHQQQFICSFQANLIKLDDHFNNVDGTKVIFELFSDRIIIEFEKQTPVTIFFDSISFILANNENEKSRISTHSSNANLNGNDGNEIINENENNATDNISTVDNNNNNNADNNNNNNDSNGNKSLFNQSIFKFIKNLGFNKKNNNGKSENKNINEDANEDVFIEVFTLSLQSYLFQLSFENKNKLLKIISKLGVLIITRADEFISKHLIPAWDNGNISTFDFLLSLSILQGRSFNRADQYPFFPSPSIIESLFKQNAKNTPSKKSNSKKNVIPQFSPFNNQEYLEKVEGQLKNCPDFMHSISSKGEGQNIDLSDDQKSPIQNINFGDDVMPEFYYKFGWNEFELNGKDPYQNRKELENIEYRKILGRYASDRYGIPISGVPRFTVPSNRNNLSNILNNMIASDEKVAINSPFINLGNNIVKFDRILAIFGKYVNHFVYLEENGTVSLTVIDWKTFKFIKTRNLINASFTDSVVCASCPNSLVLYDMSLNKMLKVIIDSKKYCNITVPPIVSYSCPLIINSNSKIKILDGLIIAVNDKTSVISCPISTFPKYGIRFIYDNKEDEIIKIKVHSRILNTKNSIITKSNGMIVFLTKSGLLKAVSLSNGLEIGEFNLGEQIKIMDSNKLSSFHDVIHITNQNSFDDGKKVKILITDSLSLIIVAVGLKIMIFSSELRLIKVVPIVKPIISWISYSMFDGIDYIVYVQSDFLLCSFEAYFPENVKSIEYITLLSSKNQSQSQSTSDLATPTPSTENLSNNLTDPNSEPDVFMRYIRNENMIAIFSKNGLLYTYYHPKLNLIPLTLSL